ncbi:DMT family transporter [Sulfurovum mangrovi]|uniref:DMT family transporter n=1 Tax=Sulfurovum mangrovi TaxID=2893889 RepID=UPI001E33BA63|nr:DMT family transporter [Sulfurovum mangrovi]UFH59694.1 DMT family transporter [Sulfurovum mangrovi]UFH60839.1 DMT family transporter [Sulfurovum mangrovi]
MPKSQNSTRYLIGMIVAMLLWGMAWTAGKMAAAHATPQVAGFWRYAISFLSILPVIWMMKIPFKTDLKGVFYMIAAGLLTALFNYLFFAGLVHGEAGYGGTMVTALSPIVTYLISIAFLGVAVAFWQIVALTLGIAGALILLRVPYEGLGFLTLESIYFLGCAIVWAVVTIFAQKASHRAHPMFYTTVVFGVAGLTNMLFALPYHPFDVGSYDSTFWWTMIFIGLFPGTFSTALYFISAGKIGAHNTGVFMFIVPVGAIVSSWIVFDEQIAMSTIVGCLLAFAAVSLFGIKRG